MHTSRIATRQNGAFLIAVALALVTIVTVVFATGMLEAVSRTVKRTATSQLEQFVTIEEAIVRYVALNRRLPCPADGSLPTSSSERGKELRDSTSQICTSATSAVADQKTGVVPWVTLGLREADVTSADLTYFSFRVYSGTKGLTLDNGVDMSPCDTDNTPNADAALAVNGLCASSHDNTPVQFLQGKGLNIDKDSAITSGAAFVLIHHGGNAKGAFIPSGQRNAVPASTNTKEYANTQGTDPTTYTATYYASTPNITSNPAGDDFFDDRIAFLTIEDIAKKTALIARNWPDDYLNVARTTNMETSSTDPQNPHFMTSGSGQTAFTAQTSGGDTVLNFGAGVGSYKGCIWWPNPFKLLDGTARYRLSVYSEFSLADNANDEAAGFTVGLLSSDGGLPTNSTCGGDYTGRLGWADGTLSTNYANRFAIEVDTRQNDGSPFDANDPSSVHMAIDYGGTVHGSTAESCSPWGYGKGCDRAPSSSFLTANGINTYHSLRLDITKGCTLQTTATGSATDNPTKIYVTDQSDIGTGMTVSGTGIASNATVSEVSGSEITLSAANTGEVSGIVTFYSSSRIMVKGWVLSNAGCAASSILCGAMQDTGIAFTSDMSANAEALHIKRCLSPATPVTAYDQVYFGITTANYRSSGVTGANFSIRELRTAMHQAN